MSLSVPYRASTAHWQKDDDETLKGDTDELDGEGSVDRSNAQSGGEKAQDGAWGGAKST